MPASAHGCRPRGRSSPLRNLTAADGGIRVDRSAGRWLQSRAAKLLERQARDGGTARDSYGRWHGRGGGAQLHLAVRPGGIRRGTLAPDRRRPGGRARTASAGSAAPAAALCRRGGAQGRACRGRLRPPARQRRRTQPGGEQAARRARRQGAADRRHRTSHRLPSRGAGDGGARRGHADRTRESSGRCEPAGPRGLGAGAGAVLQPADRGLARAPPQARRAARVQDQRRRHPPHEPQARGDALSHVARAARRARGLRARARLELRGRPLLHRDRIRRCRSARLGERPRRCAGCAATRAPDAFRCASATSAAAICCSRRACCTSASPGSASRRRWTWARAPPAARRCIWHPR